MSTKHGHWINGKKSPTYVAWARMKDRCLNTNDASYNYYGGRGITVCEKWLKFEGFLEDMGIRPERVDVLSLERIDNNKGYYKENCKWASKKEQSLNRGLNKNNTTGYKNISKVGSLFRVGFGRDYKYICIGDYENIEDAIAARNAFIEKEKNG